MKLVVFALLAAIILSLGSGLYYLSRDDADSSKVLKALKIRVALSVVLILFLVAAYFMGWIQPPTPLRFGRSATSYDLCPQCGLLRGRFAHPPEALQGQPDCGQ